jgi:hypothetical protein
MTITKVGESENFSLEVDSLNLIQSLELLSLRLPRRKSGWLILYQIDDKLFIKRVLNEKIIGEIDIPCKGGFLGKIDGPWALVPDLVSNLKFGTIKITGGYSKESLIKFNDYTAYTFSASIVATEKRNTYTSLQGQLDFNIARIDILQADQADVSTSQRLIELSKYIKELDNTNSGKLPSRTEEIALVFERNSRLASLIKAVRGSACQICGYTFSQTNGGNYSELHHLEHLANGGLDVSNNLIVLCANHHRQFHYGKVTIVAHTQDRIVIELDGKVHECQM